MRNLQKSNDAWRGLKNSDARVTLLGSTVHPSADPTSITLYAFDLKEKETTPSGAAPSMPTPGIKGRPGSAAAEKRLRYANNLSEGKQDLLRPFELTVDQPLVRFDSSKIRLYTDTSFIPVANYSLLIYSNRRKLTLQLNLTEV